MSVDYIYQPDRPLLREQIRKFAHYVTGKVLDIGGGGHNRYKKYFKCTDYITVDIYAGKDVDVVGSADDLLFRDGSFDSVVCTQVLEHVKYPEKCVQEVRRVLKTGGVALINVPQWNELHEEPHDYWRYTDWGIQELFMRNGFDVVASDQRGGFYLTLAQMRIRFCIDRYRLFHRPILGRIASRVFAVYGGLAEWRDRGDRSAANRKHAIGWCFVFRKK